MRIKGGTALKRPKVKMFHMCAKPTDHDMVKACFALTAFNAELWLKSLNKETKKTPKTKT